MTTAVFARLRAGATLTVLLAMGAIPRAAAAQTPWSDRLAIAEKHKVAALTERRFTHTQFWRAIPTALKSPRLTVKEVGKSMQGRELRTVTFGKGPVKVFMWSQMHGNEATATMALADIFAFLASREPSTLRDRIENDLTVTFLPMLNPDGAEIFQRENAAGIDINRDVRRLATPEGRTLKAVRDAIVPDYAFNLHDQNARTRAGNGEGGHRAAATRRRLGQVVQRRAHTRSPHGGLACDRLQPRGQGSYREVRRHL